jgi:predicted nucleic acid-binding protein
MTNDQTPVGIDTNILIFSTRSQADLMGIADIPRRKSCKEQSRYAVRLIDRLRSQNRLIPLSTISLGEYLVKVKPEDHLAVIKQLESFLSIVGYTQRAASIAAKIAATTATPKRAARQEGERMITTADTKIMASLIAGGAQTVYLNDKRACQLGKPYVETLMLPMSPSDLLEYGEDKEAEGREA